MEQRQRNYHPDMVTHHDALSHASEAFKITRTNVEFSSIDQPLRTLIVTSSNQAEGKTGVAANLAITYAQIGRKVLLIDADLRRPAVHRMFGLTNRRGLTNALIGGGSGEEYIQDTLTENLFVLTSGPIPPNPAELLMSESMNRLLAQVKPAYDLILFDCPPVGAVTDAAIMATKVDGVLFVVRAGKVDRRQLQRSAALLGQVKARVLGYVLNGISEQMEDAYYYYYYQQGYYAEDSALAGRKANRRNRRKNKRQKNGELPRKAARSVRAANPPLFGDKDSLPHLESEDD